jgi:hypothetical protein
MEVPVYLARGRRLIFSPAAKDKSKGTGCENFFLQLAAPQAEGDTYVDFIERTIELAAGNVEQGGTTLRLRYCEGWKGPVRGGQSGCTDPRSDRARRDHGDSRGGAHHGLGTSHRLYLLYIGTSLSDVSGRDVLLQPGQGRVHHDAGRLFSLLQRRS